MLKRMLVCSGAMLLASAMLLRANTANLGETVITADQLTFDYQRSIAVFEGNVEVTDPQIKMKADKVNVVMNSTNSVKSIVAQGNVRIWYQEKTATCQNARYLAKTGEIVLTGNAVLTRANDSVQGDEIIFRLNDDRVTCKPGRLIFHPDKNMELPKMDATRKNR